VTQALAPWHEFYSLLGSASATMVGLLFVAASVGTGMFSRNRLGGLRMFLSATVVHFASILAACLIVLAPIASAPLLGLMIAGSGLFGLAYYRLALRAAERDGISARIDREDRFWYALLPIVGYAGETCSGLGLMARLEPGCVGLAMAMAVLLLVAIHNAWDITVWSITRERP